MRSALLTLALLFALPAVAAPVPKPSKKANYYPLVVGSKWEYEKADGGADTWTAEVTRFEEKDGVRFAEVAHNLRMRFGGRESGLNYATHLRLTAEGVVQVNDVKDADSRELILTADPRSGDTWKGTWKAGGHNFSFERQVGKPEKLVVPAGTFTAIPVTSTVTAGQNKSRTTTWYAPEVGVVKLEYEDGSAFELKEFTPGK